jgi:hypothetical protein
MIKVTYETHEEKIKKPEITEVNIFDGRYFIKYNVPNKAKMVVDQMVKDGRRGVLFSRGLLIQIFPNKKEEEILMIVKKDIKNGVYVAEQKTKKKIEIKNLRIEKK